jgi:hypothetical protein
MSKSQITRSADAQTKKRPRPENKDNLDSRKNEEFDTKGDDITHNKKETHSELKKKNKNN